MLMFGLFFILYFVKLSVGIGFCNGIFALNQEQLKNCFLQTKMGGAFVHLDEGMQF